MSEKNYVYLKEIRYGGFEQDYQYKINFEYDSIPHAFVDYRSRSRQELERRIKLIQVFVKTGATHDAFAVRYSYTLQHSSSELTPVFYLRSIQKTFASGESEPAQTFQYNEFSDFLEKANWAPVEKINPYLEKFGAALLSPERRS